MKILNIVLVAISLVLSSCKNTVPNEDAALLESLNEAYQKLETLETTRIPNKYFVHLMFVMSHLSPEDRRAMSLAAIDFDPDTGKVNLAPVAAADLKFGRFNILQAGGLSPYNIEAYYKDMEKRFGVHYIPFGVGCITHPWISAAVTDHNRIVEEALAKKYGRDVLQEEFEAWLGKQRHEAEPVNSAEHLNPGIR